MTWRVGLLIPSSHSVIETDFYRRFPHDTTLHTGRMYLADPSPAGKQRMLDQFVMPAAEAMRTVAPDVVVFGCTSAECLRGKEYDSELCQRIGQTTGAISISVTAAINWSLRATQASRIAVIAPHTEEKNIHLKNRLEAEGFNISAMHGMGVAEADVSSITPEEIYSFVQSRIGARIAADALFLSCTNYQALGALSLLKMTYDVPIVTSNLAALQAVKRELDAMRERALDERGHPAAVRDRRA